MSGGRGRGGGKRRRGREKMRREGRGEEEETLRGLETRFGEERFAKDTVRIGLEEKPCPEILSGFTRFYGHPLYLLHRVTE